MRKTRKSILPSALIADRPPSSCFFFCFCLKLPRWLRVRIYTYTFYFHTYKSENHVPSHPLKRSDKIQEGVFSQYRVKYEHSPASYTFICPLSGHYIPLIKELGQQTPGCSLSLCGWQDGQAFGFTGLSSHPQIIHCNGFLI